MTAPPTIVPPFHSHVAVTYKVIAVKRETGRRDFVLGDFMRNCDITYEWIPYTCYLYHIPTGKKYYGMQHGRVANPMNLWKTYFSSSKKVKALIDKYGKDSFTAEVRKTFTTAEDCRLWEQTVLVRVKAIEKDDWLNQSLAHGKFYSIGPKDENHKRKIGIGNLGNTSGKANKGSTRGPETRLKQRNAKLGKPSNRPKDYVVPEEIRALIRAARARQILPPKESKYSCTLIKEDETLYFDGLSKAAKYLNEIFGDVKYGRLLHASGRNTIVHGYRVYKELKINDQST